MLASCSSWMYARLPISARHRTKLLQVNPMLERIVLARKRNTLNQFWNICDEITYSKTFFKNQSALLFALYVSLLESKYFDNAQTVCFCQSKDNLCKQKKKMLWRVTIITLRMLLFLNCYRYSFYVVKINHTGSLIAVRIIKKSYYWNVIKCWANGWFRWSSVSVTDYVKLPIMLIIFLIFLQFAYHISQFNEN